MKARDEAREFFELKVRPRLERLEGRTSRLSSKDDPSLVSAATTSMQRMIKNKKDSSSGLTRTLRRTRRVVIVGDSLVTGVGCRVDRCDGPMLPRRLGEVIAAGADAVAVISAVWGAADPGSAAADFAARFQTSAG